MWVPSSNIATKPVLPVLLDEEPLLAGSIWPLYT